MKYDLRNLIQENREKLEQVQTTKATPVLDEDTSAFLSIHMLSDGFKDVDDFSNNGFRVYMMADPTHPLAEDVSYFNHYYGLSFSESIKDEERIIFSVYSPHILGKYEELIFELKTHPTEKDSLILLSNYGPADVTLDIRLMLLSGALEGYSKGFKNVYLSNNIKLIDNFGANDVLVELLSKVDNGNLSDDDTNAVVEFVAELDRISYFPMRDQMMMVNMMDFKLMDMEHTKIVYIQLQHLVETGRALADKDFNVAYDE